MPRRLLLLRHAKSSWDDLSLPDFDRPLAPRGERDAPRMGAELARRGPLPDRILVSPARRARQTAQRFLPAAGLDPDAVEIVPALYGAGPVTLQRALSELPDPWQCALLIGHNPGLEEWIEQLTGAYLRMPTAALACIALESPDRGRLAWSVAPKDAP